MKNALRQSNEAGLSMVEVLLAIVVISVGVLGVVKMQTAAISNTQIARVRSLIALQAGSLASAMHGNPTFWANPSQFPTRVTISGTSAVAAGGGAFNNANSDCIATLTFCSPSFLAKFDVTRWAWGMNNQFPGYSALVTCTNTANAPVSCTIAITWAEKYVAINKSTAEATTSQTSTQTFTLYVQP